MLTVSLLLTGASTEDVRSAELWDMTGLGATTLGRVPVVGGQFSVDAQLPATWAVSVARSPGAGVTGPDFRSAVLPRPPSGTDRAQLSIAFVDGISRTADDLTAWLRTTLPAQTHVALPAGVAADFTDVTGHIQLADGTMTISVTGGVVLATPAGSETGGFSLIGSVGLSPSSQPGGGPLLRAGLEGQPQVGLPGISGAVTDAIASAVGGSLGQQVVDAFQAAAEQALPSAITGSLGLHSVPSGATISLPTLTVSADGLSVSAALGRLAVGAPTTPPGSAVSRLLWTQIQDMGPTARAGHAMAHHQPSARIVLFGGHDAADVFGDTWEWDGEFWSQAQDMGPSPRHGHCLGFDVVSNHVVLFGGADATGAPLGDTWEWDGSYWTQVADTGPTPRHGAAAAYDLARGRWVLVGGRGADQNPAGGTWEWDGVVWTQVADSGGGPDRSAAAAAYDDASGRVLLTGGFTALPGDPAGGMSGTGTDPVGGTWEWDGSTWLQTADAGPGPLGAAVFATVGGGTGILHGGTTGDVLADAGMGAPKRGGAGTGLRATWLWRARRWTQVQDIGPARFGHAMAYDSARRRLVLFGGQAQQEGAFFGDTWETANPTPQ